MIKPGLEVVFSNGTQTLSLFYMIYEWNAAQTFFSLIKEAKSNQIPLYSDTSFNIEAQDEQRLINDINLCIAGMNEQYNLNIKEIKNETDLNELHRSSAPVDCDLWRVINDRIHAYEQYKVQQNNEPRVNAYFRFETNDTVSLTQEDFLFFKTDREFGDLCMNYTHKGKHWLEIQSDNDIDAVTDGQLQPENRISPSGYMLFRPPSPTPFFRLNKFVQWFKKHFPENPITPDLAVGYLLVGKLIMPDSWKGYNVPSRSSWTKFLCQYKEIKEVNIVDINITNIDKYLKESRMTNATD